MAGSLHYEKVDATDYSAWGVDYLNYNYCYTKDIPAQERYTTISKALSSVDRDYSTFGRCRTRCSDAMELDNGESLTISRTAGQRW